MYRLRVEFADFMIKCLPRNIRYRVERSRAASVCLRLNEEDERIYFFLESLTKHNTRPLNERRLRRVASNKILGYMIEGRLSKSDKSKEQGWFSKLRDDEEYRAEKLRGYREEFVPKMDSMTPDDAEYWSNRYDEFSDRRKLGLRD